MPEDIDTLDLPEVRNWTGAVVGKFYRGCWAQDALARHLQCEPVEGVYDGKPQKYCKHCGRKM